MLKSFGLTAPTRRRNSRIFDDKGGIRKETDAKDGLKLAWERTGWDMGDHLLMKACFLVLLLMLATLTSQKALAQSFPLKAGTFSTTVTGSIAVCLNPTTFVEEACTTKGVFVAPITVLSVGRGVADAQGNACASVVETDSDFPVDASPPLVTKNEHNVTKLTTYDSNTGVGDATGTTYTGGHCNGASFDSTGATVASTSTAHIVVSENGNRVDAIVTSISNSTKSLGDFSLYAVDRAQTTVTP
jgi:hypothetical protein